MMPTEQELNELLRIARVARENAFVPRSDHSVGAAVLTTDGFFFAGCNVESNISGLGICAERSAIDNAIVHGKYEFKTLLTLDEKPSISCGACLQYLLQFYVINNKDITILTADQDGQVQHYSLLQLLPTHYLPQHNLEKIKGYKNKA